MIYHEQSEFTLHRGDCVEKLKAIPDQSIDSFCVDGPYGIRFMGKAWDGADIERRFQEANTDSAARAKTGRAAAAAAGKYSLAAADMLTFQEFTRAWAVEAFRILKPGGHLVSFCSTRTYHRMAAGVEDAGFEIRDQLAWVFGSGFPKSLDVSKTMDRANGEEPRQVGVINRTGKASGTYGAYAGPSPVTEPVTEPGRQWAGWGTALKPAWEPIVLARKPLDGTVAQNVAKWGTGALNIDGCRVSTAEQLQGSTVRDDIRGGSYAGGYKPSPGDIPVFRQNLKGRWPANLCHDGSPEVIEHFPEEAPSSSGIRSRGTDNNIYGKHRDTPFDSYGDEGSAARFFYCAKTSRADRDEGLEGFDKKPLLWSSGTKNPGSFQSEGTDKSARNSHPTVKPTELMRWLVRLVTPPGGRVVDCFTGSGSTGKACVLEGFHFTGIDLDEEGEYLPIAKARILYALEHKDRWEQIHAAPAPEPDTEGQALMAL